MLGLTYIDGTCVEMLAAKTVRRGNTGGVPGVKTRCTTSFCGKSAERQSGRDDRVEGVDFIPLRHTEHAIWVNHDAVFP